MLYYIYLVDLSYFMIVQSHFYFSLVNLHTAIAIKICDFTGHFSDFNCSLYIHTYIRDVKHKARGLELARERLQSGPSDFFRKCKGLHRF